MELTSHDLVEMYRLMLLGRRFTEHVLKWYKEGRLSQGLHPSIGQEAVGVGACYGLRRQDWVIPSLRTSEAFFTRGVTLAQQFNAMLGTAGSISRGKETSHHATYPTNGILPGTGIVGGSIPVAVGAAVALRMQRTDHVVLCFFGDGAVPRGDFHEGINMAAVRKAPVVFLCENNRYFQTGRPGDGMLNEDVADRAVGYGIPGVIVDGQDVLAVYEETQKAIELARSGGGPTLLDVKTYRFKPHYPIFPEDRPADELEKWLQRDPLTIHGERLKSQGQLDDTTIAAMDEAILQELENAMRQAETTPAPDPNEVFQAVYAEPVGEMGL
jgi:acetoin:2,6-dichlorophenolindophenol oxidoreductase subunit alpha